MATVTIRDEDRSLNEAAEISDFLGQFGIWYRRFDGQVRLEDDASEEKILEAYAEPIRQLMEEVKYATAYVIDVSPVYQCLVAMLYKFN